MITAHLRNNHGKGWDIYTGEDVASGRRVGHIYWDTQDQDNGGLVLRLQQDPSAGYQDELPESAAEAVDYLARSGYELDPVSVEDVHDLIEAR